MRIYYAIENTVLGRLLVATTDQGICSVMLGEDEPELLRELEHKYPKEKLTQNQGKLQRQIEDLRVYLEGRKSSLDLPLDEQGTPFQRRVWKELRRIPYGEKITYSELARRIGRPTAVRAVAGACARNPVALLTPCHRVVRQNGELGGYRWGIERKRWLLESEQTQRLKKG